ncbi:sulfurtransferase FdhD [Sneathiella sp. P13V-1]|uniref:formate dehydrogenase accessory sulfurtransferase FdhD n=1 Tax=Sneathiella sp. P13V-1 TaxID=2697366 RepID=UPI00187BB326|nr:formate dehydrogenase accessory sulfurtransferase FdhD [Sneathiella sp. P13V-1]MBE7638549.1 sulfurtransferase FdhD [Sneathiella sp. P13V-1]
MKEFEISPNIEADDLYETVKSVDHEGNENWLSVINEKPLTIYLNKQEIVTLMTIGDYPEYLAVGYLVNQNMLRRTDSVTSIDVDEDLQVVIVRTAEETNYEEKLSRKIRTSGCAQGTVFGDVMEKFDDTSLDVSAKLKTSWIYALSKKINQQPSLYLKVGAIHGCVLCEGDRPLIYMEDVGRHNAIDKIAGYMWLNNVPAMGKLFYTTGRLTSEMVIKTVQMQIPVLISRSGFTAWGVELAKQVGLTLVGRAKGKRFQCVSGVERLVFDADPETVLEENKKHQRKGGQD